ncbi:hypothetical protein [Chitinolyticbacter meiyuanensis]|uniref:hypothetical protein n=1 Tax=Chitinolyticbacter meiyuanensis TaxID=682798 RepID=UPI0011E5BDC3|nr:hypothetical protein [Chitinolyticbacter meiyuanensis]
MSPLPLLDPQRVAALENDAHARPTLYRTRTAMVAAAGYATVAGLLLVGFTVLIMGALESRVVMAVSGLAFMLGGFYVVLGCLSQQTEPPSGRTITANEAPELFRTLDKIRRKTGAPAPAAVIVDDAYRAALVEQARFGPFGGYRHYIVIGLPLLLSLSSSELAAMLTMEHGRFCARQGRFAIWVCRLRRLWNQLYSNLQQENGVLGEFVARFYLWYIPHFQAYALTFAREQEARATERAAAVIGSHATASALTKLTLFGRFHDEHYWPAYWRQADHRADPPCGPYAGLAEGYRQGERIWRSSRWLKEALARKPEYDDPDPGLSQRLAQLSQEARPTAWPRQSAGEKWLGVTLGKLVAEFDREWLALNRQHWQARFRTARQEDSELATLRLISPDTLENHQLWRLAELTHARHGSAEARPLVERVLTRQPEHLKARFLQGRLLLEAGEERGLDMLEEAMKQDQQSVDEGMGYCERYLVKRGRRHDVDALWARLGHYHGWVDAA